MLINKIKHFIKHKSNEFYYSWIFTENWPVVFYIAHQYSSLKTNNIPNCEILVNDETKSNFNNLKIDWTNTVIALYEYEVYFGFIKIKRQIKITDVLKNHQCVNCNVYFNSEFFCYTFIRAICSLRNIKLNDIKVYKIISTHPNNIQEINLSPNPHHHGKTK